MLGMIRLGVILFVILTAFYWALSWYFRSLARGALEREWDEEIRQGDRDAFITQGMADYDISLKKKLVWGVYIVPIVVVIALVYLTNYA
ncbi:MAG: hypothetical protein GKR99_13640 [Rhodobacteraceae bacterium]|nr:hypothetical protein [Paracoccaceae bacterium]